MVVVLLIITTLLWGVTPIFEKIGLARTEPLTGLTIRSTVMTAGLLVTTFLLGKGKSLLEMDRKSVILFSLSGLLAGLFAMWAYYGALKMEATSKVVPIAASYPLVTALLGALILKEGFTFPKVIGTALIVSGIWLVK